MDGSGDGLKAGDHVQTLSGSAVVESVRFLSERATVYNLTITSNPSYLIGDDGLWVHNVGPFECWPGMSSEYKKHAPGRSHRLYMKAKGTPTGPPQGAFNVSEHVVADLLASRLKPGVPFTGHIPAPAGMARVFMPGTGKELPSTMIKVEWNGKRIQKLHPEP